MPAITPLLEPAKKFEQGDRVAQLIFRQTILMNFTEVDHAPKDISRGGFGSTGTK